jgi:hypothetical protein
LTAADNEITIWIRQYIIKVLQVPAGINSQVQHRYAEGGWSVQEAEQEQLTGQTYVIRTVHIGMKFYNDKFLNLFYLSIYFFLTCFRLSFSPSSEAGVQLLQWFKSPRHGVSARARMETYSSILARELTPYIGELNHCRICSPASENGLKESPKHVRQK